MKKKVFSKLLMVALVAAVGVFTSCKDYDDDINDLRSQLDGLNSSLTAKVDKDIADVKTTITSLESQLTAVKEAYIKADNDLKTALDEVKATGVANTSAIEGLRQEIVNLKATDASLQSAIDELKSGLATANATIKTQGETIASLLETDKSLTTSISEAKAAAANALAEAQKAQEAAKTNAENIAALTEGLKNANEKIAANQKAIADNLTSVTTKIDNAVATLDAQIKTLSGTVATLSETAAQNSEAVKTINTKIGELQNKDAEILAALKTAQENLTKAINDGDKKLADDIAAGDKKLADDIKAAIDRISKNETDIAWIKTTFVDQIIPAKITEEVAKQLEVALPEALKEYMKSDDIKALVATETGKNLTLIQALQAKVNKDSTDIRNYVDAEFDIVYFKCDSLGTALTTTAAQIKKEYEAADKLVQDSVDVVAATLKDVQDQINDADKGILKQIADLKTWFDTDAEGLTKIGQNIISSQAFKDAVKEAVDEANGEIYQMITSINLFANQHDAQFDWGYGIDQDYWFGNSGFDHTLTFSYAVEKANKFPANAEVADAQFSFEDGMFRSYPDSILVRVSPTNANLAKLYADGKLNLALLNTQGTDLIAKNVIEVKSVEKYNQLLTRNDYYFTHAAEQKETGLWVIKFKINDRKIGTEFEDAATTKVNGQNQKVLYAIGVQNTEAAADRYVVSEYDLDLATAPAFPSWTFYVNNKTVEKIHNRYIETDKENVVSDDNNGLNAKTFRNEYTWIGFNGVSKPYADVSEYYELMESENEDALAYIAKVPATKMILESEDADNFNTVDRLNHTVQSTSNGVDNRHKYEILPVTVGEPISIDFPDFYQFDSDKEAFYNNIFPTPIKGFYVTLDTDFALESIPSEINSWVGYDYENVGYTWTDVNTGKKKVVAAKLQEGNHGSITIKNIGNVTGDVIGFRVYAVNLDGTLYDPDGRAFYVKVGKEYDHELSFTVKAETKSQSGAIQDAPNPILAQNKLFEADPRNNDPFFNVEGPGYTYDLTWGDGNPQIQLGNALYTPVAGKQGVLGHESDNVIDDLFQFYNTTNEPATYDFATLSQNWKAMGYTKSGDNVPNYKTNNMAVRLVAANGLLDNETYNLVLTIKKGTGTNAYTVVSKTLIHVKKILPTDLPSKFHVRATQEANTKDLKFYIRPMENNQPWNINSWFTTNKSQLEKYPTYGAEKIDDLENYNAQFRNLRWAIETRPYNFDEAFDGLVGANAQYDPNYKFVFPGLGAYNADADVDAAADLKGDAVTVFRSGMDYKPTYPGYDPRKNPTTQEPGYYLPYVYYKAALAHKDANSLVAVKAGYTYRNVSLKLDGEGKIKQDANGNYAYDCEIAPRYFKADGTSCAEKDAAFKVQFECAMLWNDNTMKKKLFTFGLNVPQAPNTGLTANNAIPYGIGFTVTLNKFEFEWQSSLAADTKRPETTFAAYFLTGFNTINNIDYTAVANGKSYYKDALVLNNPSVADYHTLYDATNTNDAANYVKLVELTDPLIKWVKIGNTEFTGAAAEAALSDYFVITKGKETPGRAYYFVNFAPKMPSLNPTKLGQFQIKFNSTAKLMHQWGHTFSLTSADSNTIYYNVANSVPEEQGARQAR